MDTVKVRSVSMGFGVGICLALQLVSPFSSDAQPSGRQLVVGDVLLQPGQFDSARASTLRGNHFPVIYWPGGLLPIVFDGSVSEGQKALFYSACRNWSLVANVRCVARTTEVDSLVIRQLGQTACRTLLGKEWNGHESGIVMAPGCWNTLTIEHEIGHTLGLWHEHQREDRDQYVSVDFTRIGPELRPQYEIATAGDGLNLTAYDFQSIMHYGIGYGGVLRARLGFEQFEPIAGLGLNGRPSLGDGEGMRALYGPPTVVEPSPLSLIVRSSATGMPVAGAVLTLTSSIRSLTLVSNSDGIVAGDVPQDAYMVGISAGGYVSTAPVFYTHFGPLFNYPVVLAPAPSTSSLVEVRIVDAATALPIAGAQLTIGTTILVSGADGLARGTVPYGSYAGASISKPGYSSYNHPAFVLNQDVAATVTLNPTASALRIQVIDHGTGAPLVAATVTLNGLAYPVDVQGILEVTLPHGILTGSVSAPGYTTVQGSAGFQSALSLRIALVRLSGAP